MATGGPGASCGKCGAFVTGPEVLPYHGCKAFVATHERTGLDIIRGTNRKGRA